MKPNGTTFIAWIFALAIVPTAASAAGPSIDECLSASDRSIQFDRSHKLRAELNELLTCASESCPSDVRVECAKRAEQTSQALPTIVFEVKDAKGADLTNVQVVMDGEPLATKLDGTAIAVDPGEHTFVFRVEGEPQLQKVFVVRVSEKNRRETLIIGQPVPSETRSPTVTAVSEPMPAAHPESGHPNLGAQRIGAIGAAGVGLAGVVVGSIFGLQASSKKSSAQSICPNATCETQDGVTRWDQASKAGTISTIGFVIGGVGLASAAALWFTAPTEHATQVGFGLGGLQLRGAW